jgi:hypothetical protein
MKDVGKFYGHSVYFTVIWYILRSSGIFCGHYQCYAPGIKKPHLSASPVLYGMVESGRYWRHKKIIRGHFDHFFPFLVCRTEKNLATLVQSTQMSENRGTNVGYNCRRGHKACRKKTEKNWQQTTTTTKRKTTINLAKGRNSNKDFASG